MISWGRKKRDIRIGVIILAFGFINSSVLINGHAGPKNIHIPTVKRGEHDSPLAPPSVKTVIPMQFQKSDSKSRKAIPLYITVKRTVPKSIFIE
jgi:hypothetical protein